MRKIAYIEIDTHAEIAQNFMELMNDSKNIEVDYYFSEKIGKQIGKRNHNIFSSESTELLNQLNQKNYDLVILGTVHRYFNLFNDITKKFNTAIIVHNLNFTKISRFQLFKNIFKKDVTYRLKLWLKEDLLSAPKVFKNAKNLLVLDKSLVQEKLQYLPVFFNQYQDQRISKIFTIVIPGAVSQGRRDYKKVLQVLKDFQTDKHNNERLFQIIFLGKAEGKEVRWLKDFEKKKSSNISIRYFMEKVPQEIFDEWMTKADVLWCPIQRETAFFSNKEIYGTTKMSGNIGDAIKYGKIAFFPENYISALGFIVAEEKNVISQFQKTNDIHFDFQLNYQKARVLDNLERVLLNL